MQEKKEILFFEKNTIRISKTQNEEYHMKCEIVNNNLITFSTKNYIQRKIIFCAALLF